MTHLGIVGAAISAAALGLAIGCSGSDKDDDPVQPSSGGRAVSTATGGTLTGGSGGGSSTTGGSGGSVGNFESFLDCGDTYANLADCGATATTAEVRPVDILLVVDKSGSMTIQPAGYEDRKWSALRNALDYALNQLLPYARFGLELFPRKDTAIECGDTCCQMGTAVDVPIGFGTVTVPQILAELAEPTGPGGRTPTAAALRLAYDYFANLETGIEGGGHEMYVVLATDGGPNCGTIESCPPNECTVNLDGTYADYPAYCDADGPANCCDPASIQGASPIDCLDDDATLAEIERLLALGIKTVVIGIPGSEPYEAALNAFAVAGGASNPREGSSYYRVEANRPEELTAVFVDIVMNLIKSCEIYLEESPPGLDLVNVALDCVVVPRIDPDTGAENWEIVGTETGAPPMLRLLDPLCTQALSAGVRRVDVLFGCPTIG
jgi:hypothetical protein